MENPKKYSIEIYAGADKAAHAEEINKYIELRAHAFKDKWGKKIAAGYEKADEYDKRDDTIFLIFRARDPETGEDVIFGGRRITFRTPSLPFEKRHAIIDQNASRFKPLVGKTGLKLEHVIPAIEVGDRIYCAELGAFAVDKQLKDSLFNAEEYKTVVRSAIYRASIEAAKRTGADVAIICPEKGNRENQIKWLENNPEYPFKHLGRTMKLFTNPAPAGSETEILLVNLSGRYSLKDAEGILRYNQVAAKKVRDMRG